MTDAVEQLCARPYGWVGLALSLVAIPVLTVLIWYCATVLVFAAEILVHGWAPMSARLVDAYRALQGGDPLSSGMILLIGPVKNAGNSFEIAALLSTCLIQLALIAAVLVLACVRGGRFWRDLIGWHRSSAMTHARLFTILLLSVLVLNWAIGVVSDYFVHGPHESVPRLSMATAVSLFSAVVLAPFSEELVIRGWLYSGLRARLAAWPTILITAVIFAVLHSISSPFDIASTLPLGVAAGFLRERTGSVKPPILFHIVHNVIVFAILLFSPPGGG